MSKYERHKTRYPGVYYIVGQSNDGKPEKIFYIFYRREGRQIEEKVGRQFLDAMTEAKANAIRSDRMRGKAPTNDEKRAIDKAKKSAKKNQWTINRLWEEYLDNHAPKSVSIDKSRYNKYIRESIGKKEPKDVAAIDIRRFQSEIEKKDLAPGSVKKIMELLRRTINFGIKQELIPPSAPKVQLPEVHDEKTEQLTKEQLAKLWAVLEEETNIQAVNFIKMVMFTGLRRGELFKLKWIDIDFENGFLTLVDPKGGRDQKVPLNSDAIDLLINHERPYPDSPFVFPGKEGNQRTSIKKPVNRIKEKAGLPEDFRPLHGLRHTYATLLASSGEVDIYTLQKLLTHKDPKTTQRYAHLIDESLKRASNVTSDIINQISTKAKD